MCECHGFCEAEVDRGCAGDFWCKVDNGWDPIDINDLLDVLCSSELLTLEVHGIDW
jgi:hypothetical protein